MNTLRKFIFAIIVIFLLVILATLISNHGKLFKRYTNNPRSIEYSIKEKLFIDSFYTKKLNNFEIWRSNLGFIDYYGIIPLYEKHWKSNETYCLAIRNKMSDGKEYWVSIKCGDQNQTIVVHNTSNYILCYNKLKSKSTIVIKEHIGQLEFLSVDSLNISW